MNKYLFYFYFFKKKTIVTHNRVSYIMDQNNFLVKKLANGQDIFTPRVICGNNCGVFIS